MKANLFEIVCISLVLSYALTLSQKIEAYDLGREIEALMLEEINITGTPALQVAIDSDSQTIFDISIESSDLLSNATLEVKAN